MVVCERCSRRIVRLRGPAQHYDIIEQRPGRVHRRPIPSPDNVAEVFPGASIKYENGGATLTCSRGHVTALPSKIR
jgi:hypothetical protein